VRSQQWGFFDDESGAELLEWAIVTVILVVATYAILQAVGSEFGAVASTVLYKIRDFVGL
jgi:Flp pilus assembly pilin Flp